MTDTITETVVDRTIVDLESTLQRAIARYDTEAVEYAAKRDAMVKVAHRLGTRHSIGEALDDLLAEFDLPRRQPTGVVQAVVGITSPVGPATDHVTTPAGRNVYRAPGMRVLWFSRMSTTVSMVEGQRCLCDNIEATVRQWLMDNFGTGFITDSTFQIGPHRCRMDDCPVYDDPSPTEVMAESFDWTTVPHFPAIITPPTPEAPSVVF